MKIEIDFDKRIIKVGSRVNFKKLSDFIKTLDNWKDYEIETHTEITWGSYKYYPYIPYTVNSPTIYPYCSSGDAVLTTSTTNPLTGTVQFELN